MERKTAAALERHDGLVLRWDGPHMEYALTLHWVRDLERVPRLRAGGARKD